MKYKNIVFDFGNVIGTFNGRGSGTGDRHSFPSPFTGDLHHGDDSLQ